MTRRTKVKIAKIPKEYARHIPKGWEVTKNVEPSKFDVSKLMPLAVLRNNEIYINTDTMRERAVEAKANWGLVDGLKIIASWTPELAKRFNGAYILLPGTELRGSVGLLRIPCLRCYGGRCVLDFYWLGSGWDGLVRFAVSESDTRSLGTATFEYGLIQCESCQRFHKKDHTLSI